MLATGTTLAGYRIESVLGQGGMGVVYEASQLSLDRTVALKVIASGVSDDGAFRERFRREGCIQAAIDHPNIITVYEAGDSEYGLFLAMRLVRGPTLKEMIEAGELDAERTLRLLLPIADAVDAAHAAGLIHRDIKPQNILVGRRDQPYLADFGLTKEARGSKLTRSGQVLGTLDYISPEQIRCEPASAGSDVYGLAAVLYECLTGAVPYPMPSGAAVLCAHLSDNPPRLTDSRPDLPSGLDDVVARGMAKTPEERHGSATEMLRDAARALGSEGRALDAPMLIESSQGSESIAPEARAAGLGPRSADLGPPQVDVVRPSPSTAGGVDSTARDSHVPAPSGKVEALRVVLADDSVLLREGLARLVEDAGFEVAGQASNAEDLLRKVRAHHPELAVTDIRMPPTQTDEGLRAAQEIRAEMPDVGVVVLSQHLDDEYAFELLQDSAEGVGYLLKDRVADIEGFTDALRRVAAGGSVLDPEVVRQLVGRRKADDPLDRLTSREREVLRLMAEGHANSKIAEELVVSGRAVQKHVTNIFSKLGLSAAEEGHRRVLAVLTYLKQRH